MEYSIEEARIEYEAIIDELLTKYNFGDTINDTSRYYKWFRANEYEIGDIHYRAGSTRVVIYTNSSKYVYKFQYVNDEYNIDYCLNELKVYEFAKEVGCEQALAWCGYLGKIHGIDVYAFEKCEANEDKILSDVEDRLAKEYCDDRGYDFNNLTEEQQEEVNEHSCSDGDSDSMEEYVYNVWDNHLFNKFVDMCEALDLNDLHCGNFGYNHNGQLVVIDYAGFHKELNF